MRWVCVLALLGACTGSEGELDDAFPPTTDDTDTDVGGDTGDTDTDTGDPTDTDTPDVRFEVCGLLENPSAETGDTTGWVGVGDFGAVQSGSGRPDPYLGQWFFSAGQTEFTQATQVVDVSAYANDIDAGGLVAHFSGQMRDWATDDEVGFALSALDDSGTLIQEVTSGPHRDEWWTLRRGHLELPQGTRQLQVQLTARRQRGTDNDGYFDAMDLCIDEVAAPTAPAPRRGPWLNWVTPTEISVMWESADAALGGVDYGTSTELGEHLDEAAAGTTHEVRLTGLAPDTVYTYRITQDGLPGEVFSFRTAPDQAVPFRFVVWGDNQNGPDIFGTIVDRMEVRQPEFALAVGDIVQEGTRGNYRDQLFDPLVGLAAETSFLVAAGNHERYSDGNASLFNEYLSQPGDEHCFGWTYGGVYFLFIDTELSVVSGSQLQCIEDALASPEFAAADLQMALFHYPPRIQYWAWWFYDDASPYDGDEDVRDVLEPVFDAAGVDLVFNGHNHLYAHTPGGAYSNVTWVTTGGGGGDIDTSGWYVETWDGMTTTIHDHHFLEVDVNGTTAQVKAIGLDGQELHRFDVNAVP